MRLPRDWQPYLKTKFRAHFRIGCLIIAFPFHNPLIDPWFRFRDVLDYKENLNASEHVLFLKRDWAGGPKEYSRSVE